MSSALIGLGFLAIIIIWIAGDDGGTGPF